VEKEQFIEPQVLHIFPLH